jgi:hypothetical protein
MPRRYGILYRKKKALNMGLPVDSKSAVNLEK